MKAVDSPDEKLVKKVIAGDVDNFREIINRYENRIYSVGIRFFRNADDARDFTQDVLLRVFNNLGSYRGRAPFRYWIMRIAYNLGINRVNSLKTESDIEKVPVVSPERSPDSAHEQDEIVKILNRSIEKLPERYRVCIDLYFFSGLAYREIQDITGYPVNTIKSNVLRAKNILRDALRGTIAEEYYEM